jgi:NADH dehydrogenase (ubiquinone) Fe-S protein 7
MLLTLLVTIVKPTTAIVPFRTTAAAFTTNSRRDASALQTHSATGVGKVRREVPLPSEIAPKGALQYALYVIPATFACVEKIAFVTQILDQH